MSVHRTRFAEQTVEVVAVHPHGEAGYVRLEVFYTDGTERTREVDVTLDPDQARAIAAGLARHADLAERTWAEALTDTRWCATCRTHTAPSHADEPFCSVCGDDYEETDR